jgi:hypothetical protein
MVPFLTERGAVIDARDIDHESTPAQYMLRVEQRHRYPHDRLEVARDFGHEDVSGS